MRRVGGLFDRICEIENLRLATHRAIRGKRHRPAVEEFLSRCEAELSALSADIADGTVTVGDYQHFVIHDPKRRRISAPSLRERILHHAIMNVCEPVLERFAIRDSYACRVGGGQHAALDRALRCARNSRYFLKLDVRAYFDSIPKDRLLGKLQRRFRDKRLLHLLDRIIESYEPGENRGLPIGALTSQHFANFYLGYLDHYVKEVLRVKHYLRYMDDFVLWNHDRELLSSHRDAVVEFAASQLGLDLKEPVLRPVQAGMDYLGHRVFPSGLRLNRRSRRRFRARVAELSSEIGKGDLGESEVQARLTSLVAATQKARCNSWRLAVCDRYGLG
ncbi:MAG: reverse transcriptase/maturase family protein [Verrucomicrobiota bacterium]